MEFQGVSSLMWSYTVIFLCGVFGLVDGSDYCYTTNYYYEYCKYGCCDSYSFYKKCCSQGVGVIAGAVVGAIVLVIIIAAIIVACYMCKKKRGRLGTVIQPSGAVTGATVVDHLYPMQVIQYPTNFGPYQNNYSQGPSNFSQGPSSFNQGPGNFNPGMQASAPYPPVQQTTNFDSAFPPAPAKY